MSPLGRPFVAAGISVIGVAAVISAPALRSPAESPLRSELQLISTAVPDLDLLGANSAALEQSAVDGDDLSLPDPTVVTPGIGSAIGDGVTDPYPADSIGDVLTWPLGFLESVVGFVWGVVTWPFHLLVDVVEEVWNVLTLPFHVLGATADGIPDAAAASLQDAAALPDLADLGAGLGAMLPNLDF